MTAIIIFFLFVLAAAFFVEGATELVCKSLIFSRFRDFLSNKSSFLRDLVGCGYCTSVWVALFPSLYISYLFFVGWLLTVPLFIFLVVVIHRLSNYIHNINDKHLDKYYDSRFKER